MGYDLFAITNIFGLEWSLPVLRDNEEALEGEVLTAPSGPAAKMMSTIRLLGRKTINARLYVILLQKYCAVMRASKSCKGARL